ncbi:hypothetical protein C1I95_14845 [Micromonospora craterilacus]|uniref:Uncharacterized protein n=1 Tax=Micromonospora craterilacus TaxID=1655439 RepID=A0A2W2E5J5_9ACTN|nr:hypothetical protein [Micromonospora craterilacus]PZG17823.1 hypothetical protein C1I95_14845 [Micromonospora craterilacus]
MATYDRDADRQRWLERLTAAVTEAAHSGATPEELEAAFEAGRRAAEVRAQQLSGVPAPRRAEQRAEDRAAFVPPPGSALAALMKRTAGLTR